MAEADIRHRFEFHVAADEEKRNAHTSARAAFLSLAVFLDGKLPPGREAALSLTNLEQAMFWANAAIARAEPS